MKKVFVLFLYIFISASCSTSNRIVKMDGNEPKGFRLIQSLDAYTSSENVLTTERSKGNVISTYVFTEKGKDHHEISVSFISSPASQILDSQELLSYNFDGEKINVGYNDWRIEGQFIIPENLWVSFVQLGELSFSLKSTNKEIDVKMKAPDRNKLSQFFKLAIERRDLLFPEIPEGMKKW